MQSKNQPNVGEIDTTSPPLALEVGHHDLIAAMAEQYRSLLGAVPVDVNATLQWPTPTPESLLPLAQQFAAASVCDVECAGANELGCQFTYARNRYGDSRDVRIQQVIAELRALGIGFVRHVDYADNIDFVIPLADGRQTQWFFQGSQQAREARRFFNGPGRELWQRYHLRFHEQMEGGRYCYWQPPDAEPLSQALDDLGAAVYYTEDGFFVEFAGRDYEFWLISEHPDAIRHQRDEGLKAGLRREARIREALPPVAAGHIRMFRGIVGPYVERAPLTPAEQQEFQAFFRDDVHWESMTEDQIFRFGELRGRATGQMATPDLSDVLHQYAVGPDASLLYADVTPEEFEQYRDTHAPASILSGYTTFPPGRIRWNAVRLADVDIPESDPA